MKVNGKKAIVWAFAALIVLIGAVLLTGDQGLVQLYESHQQLQRKNEELRKARLMIDSLQTEVYRLEHDTQYMERIAREKLGMAKKNEKIIKFIEEKR